MLDAIAHYKVLGPLGAGGLGDVYRARDTRVGRTVAVKVLPASIVGDPVRSNALLDAAKAASTVSHPNIAALFEGGEDAGRRFLVFEFVPGDPLNTVIEGRALNVRRAVELATQLADALADAEAGDLRHGDIRPANIIVTSKDRAKLMNFGLAAFTDGGTSRRTSSSMYVAPEEAAGSTGDIRSDIFSLGAVLFEMLTGRQRGQGLAPSSLNKNVPPELDRIVGRMLASNPDNRYQSAATAAAELRSIAAVLEARATAEEAALEKPRGRRRGRSGTVIVLGVLATIAAIGVWLWRMLAGR
jgi:eukaryotic-like serine/threonine-protein kinase